MPKPFEALGENLLRKGVAPRHVRAYLTELREHLADLVEQECAAGGDARAALVRARSRLGDDETLAHAMLSRRRVRSLTARAPWLVLGLLQGLTLVVMSAVGMMLCFGLLMIASTLLGRPELLLLLGPTVFAILNLLLAPLIVALFAMIAWRQRVAPAWVLLGCAVILLYFPHMEFWFARSDLTGLPPMLRLNYRSPDFSVNIGLFPLFHPRTWTFLSEQWILIVAQYLLTLLPVAWLWHSHRRSA